MTSVKLSAISAEIEEQVYFAHILRDIATYAPHPAARMVARIAYHKQLHMISANCEDMVREAIRDVCSSFKIKTNCSDTARYLIDIQKQVKYATAVSLTRTARRLVPLMEQEVLRVFDKPTNFIVKGFGTTPATKTSLQSTLFIKNKQAEILRPHIVGGQRGQKLFERRLASDANADGYWVPGAGVKLNAAGNMTRFQIASIAAKLKASGKYKEVFVGIPHHGEPFGIWARAKQGRGKNALGVLKPLMIKVLHPRYRKRFDFFGVAERNAQRIFNEEFSRAFTTAKQTIKPVSAP